MVRKILLLLGLLHALHLTAAHAAVLGRLSEEEDVKSASLVAGAVWYSSESGTYKIENDQPQEKRRYSGHFVADVWGSPWIVDEEGLAVVDASDEAYPFDPFSGPNIGSVAVRSIHARSGAVWIGADEGLFRIDFEEGSIADRDQLKEAIDSGRYSVQRAQLESGDELVDSIYSLKEVGGFLWAMGSRQLFVTVASDADLFRPVVLKPVLGRAEFSRLEVVQETVWVTTIFSSRRGAGRCYRFAAGGGSAGRALSAEEEIAFVTENGSEPVFGGIDAVLKLDGKGGLAEIADVEGPVSFIKAFGPEMWVVTPGRVYKKDAEGLAETVLSPADDSLHTRGLFVAQKRVWLWSNRGLFRYEPWVDIGFSISKHRWWKFGLDFQNQIKIHGLGYSHFEGHVPFGGRRPEYFDVFSSSDRYLLKEAIRKNDHQRADGTFESAVWIGEGLDLSVRRLHIGVRDPVGNLAIREFKRYIGPPPGFVSGVITPTVLFLWVVSAVAFFLAPRWLPGMAIIDSRFFRTKVSLGAIPLFLIFRWPRQWLLSRYGKHVRVVPAARATAAPRAVATSNPFLRSVEVERCVFCIGGSSQRDAAFLSFREALGTKSKRRKFRGSIAKLVAAPVYVKVDPYLSKRHQDADWRDVLAGVSAELANFGDVNNPDLALTLLNQGDFMLLLDCQTGPNDPMWGAVFQFVSRFKRENLILVGCLHSPPGSGRYGPSVVI